MGHVCHNGIVITTHIGMLDQMNQVYDKAVRVFNGKVSAIFDSDWNGYKSFFVPTDGSKEGWPEADEAEAKRKELCDFIETLAFGDGSYPVYYVDVEYGEHYEGRSAQIARTNVKESEFEEADNE